MAIEGTRATDSVINARLNYLLERAKTAASTSKALDSEPERARRFFTEIDRTLIESNAIYPPSGTAEFLHDGLELRALSETEFTRAETRYANFRRLPWMRANQQSGGSFYFLDCDLAAIFYVTIAEQLGYPVSMVEVPGHTFVRWQSNGWTLNWDPNDGISYPDDYYIRTWRVPHATEVWPKYLENLDRARVLSTWYVLCGRTKKAAADFAGALADFRQAVQTDPTDLGAVNELAWVLATCPRAELRNGAKALAFARGNVAKARRAVWLQTLAAAQAETGDFDSAIGTEKEVQKTMGTALGWANPRETLVDPEICLADYRAGRGYVDDTMVQSNAETDRPK